MVLKTTHRNLHILKLIIRLSWLFMKKVLCSFTGIMHMVKNWVAIFNPWLWLQTEVFDNTFSRKYNRSLLYATILWPWYEESHSKICFILDIKLIKETEYQEVSASSLTVFKFSTTLEGKALKICHLQWCRQAHWQMGNYFPSTKLEQLIHCSHYWILVVTCSLYLVFHKFHMYYPKYCAFLQKIKPDNQICITFEDCTMSVNIVA